MKALLGAAALLAILFPAPAPAQGRQINIFWGEDASCATWSKSASNTAIRALYEFWVRGFVSGHNYANPALQVKIGALPGSEALQQYLDQYCLNNPSLSFVGGAIRLVDDLREPDAPPSRPVARPPASPAKKAPAQRY